MTVPKRIQLRRTKNWRKPEGAIIVCRPTKWGNLWKVDPTRATDPPSNQYRATAWEVVPIYRAWLLYAAPFTIDDIRRELGGRDLACWCPPGSPCHADVLLELANPGWKPPTTDDESDWLLDWIDQQIEGQPHDRKRARAIAENLASG